ncbi:hypothetical protein Q8A73_017751 [Channa argus]|nr:hypothetical protein Q8A73_017751 [Channa argus]
MWVLTSENCFGCERRLCLNAHRFTKVTYNCVVQSGVEGPPKGSSEAPQEKSGAVLCLMADHPHQGEGSGCNVPGSS